MSSSFFLKKFLSNAHTIPELSQVSHHVYFRNLQAELIAANDILARFMGFSKHNEIEQRHYNELMPDHVVVETLANDQIVLNCNRTMALPESIILQGQKRNFLSIKSPLRNENDIIGLFGISIIFHELNFFQLFTALEIINGFFQENLSNALLPQLITPQQPSRPQLTPREEDCLCLYMKGNTTRSIASILGLSSRTIEYYIDNVKTKFGVCKRSELLQIAFNLYPELI